MKWLTHLVRLTLEFSYKRQTMRQELEISYVDTPPCHQREIPLRHRWSFWHIQKFVTHVDFDGNVTMEKLS